MVPIKIDNIQTNIRSLPNSNRLSNNMMETLRRLMNSKNSLKKIQDDEGRASISGTPIYALGRERIQINDKIYDLTAEIHKALSSTSYTGRTMKNDNDILMMNSNKNDLSCTGIGDKPSKRKTFFTKTLPKLVKEHQSETLDEIIDNSDDLQG